jgi:dTDP-4-dehydrorhamnose reductase
MTDPSNSPSQKKSALITGGQGLLARFLKLRLESTGWLVAAPSHAELDVTREDDAIKAVERIEPNVIINCATTSDVDRCEREPDWAYRVNELGPRLLARAARSAAIDIIHTSTDYVFDGAKTGYYTQEDEPNPLSVYGKSKLAGERAVVEEAERFYIIRTSWLFGEGGKNFGSRVIEYARKGVKLKGVADQTSIPTYAPDLAARIEEIIHKGAHGLYQVTNTGVTTWHEFARLALDIAGMTDVEIEPISRTDLNQDAPRPMNSAMRCIVSERIGLEPLRHWREALPEFVRDYLMKHD